MICRKCKSEMVSEYDYANRVNVIVCSNPSCLHREYPDYPRRNGNQEVCYLCGKLFTFGEKEIGIICKDCKNKISKRKVHKDQGRQQKTGVQQCSM